MRCINVTNSAIDLAAQNVPFLSNYTAVVLNPTAAPLTLQQSHEDDGGWVTLATVPAGSGAEVVLARQFIQVSTAATLVLLGN